MTTHRTPLFAAVVAAFALAASPAMADNGKGQGKHKDRGHHPAAAAHHHPGNHPGNAPKPQGRHDNGLHLGWYKQQWKRGDRIPVDYLETRYYLDDYRAYDLAPPPSGHRWVRPMDGRYLLVEVATGLVLDALGY